MWGADPCLSSASMILGRAVALMNVEGSAAGEDTLELELQNVFSEMMNTREHQTVLYTEK